MKRFLRGVDLLLKTGSGIVADTFAAIGAVFDKWVRASPRWLAVPLVLLRILVLFAFFWATVFVVLAAQLLWAWPLMKLLGR